VTTVDVDLAPGERALVPTGIAIGALSLALARVLTAIGQAPARARR